MKLVVIILLFVTCSGEKEIQVQEQLWTLVKKYPVYRYEEDPKIRLIWLGKDGIRRIEDRPIEDSSMYKIGTKLVNRDPK